MRIIKFRAWNTGKRMKKGMYSWENMVENLESELNPAKSLFAPFIQTAEFKEKPWITLMQFTGLSDGLGKEIYEGDIVKFENIMDDDEKQFIGKIIFQDCGCGFGYYIEQPTSENESTLYLLSNDFDIEIIGNIYENPKLLK